MCNNDKKNESVSLPKTERTTAFSPHIYKEFDSFINKDCSLRKEIVYLYTTFYYYERKRANHTTERGR